MAITYGNVPQFGYYDRFIKEKREGFGWNDLGPRNLKSVTLHRMVGTLRGTDGYFRNPNISSYTDYGIATSTSDAGMAGIIYLWNYVRGRRAPWASGPVSAPFGDGAAMVAKYGINAVNRDNISLEIGGTNEAIDAFTWNEIVHFIAYWADQCKVPWTTFPLNPHTGISFVIWHTEYTAGTGKKCPFQWLMDRTPQLIKDVQAFLKKHQENTVSVPTPAPKPIETGGIKIGDWVAFDGEFDIRRAWTTADVFEGRPNVVGQTSTTSKAKIIAGPNVNDEYTWWDLDIPGFGTGHVIANGMSKTTAPASVPTDPPKEWMDPAPVTELALAEPDTAGDLKISNGTNFRPVFDEVEAIRAGKQRRFAIDGDKLDVIGPDYKPGDRFTAMYRFTNDQGTEYLYLSNHARVLFADFKRIKD